MLYFKQKKFLEILKETGVTIQITKHGDDAYSFSAEGDFGLTYCLEHSRQHNYPRLFKTVTPIFTLLESVERGGFDITFIIQSHS